MKIVVALGGNALARRGEVANAENLRRNVRESMSALVPLAMDHQLVLTHGNGPQVGLLALQNLAYQDVAAYPLDILGAETQGMLGDRSTRSTMRTAWPRSMAGTSTGAPRRSAPSVPSRPTSSAPPVRGRLDGPEGRRGQPVRAGRSRRRGDRRPVRRQENSRGRGRHPHLPRRGADHPRGCDCVK